MTGPNGRSSSNLIALAGIGVLLLFAFGTHSCMFRNFGLNFMGDGAFQGWRFFPYSLLGLGGLLQVGLAVWVGYDAHKRGLNGFLWGLLVLFTFIVGLIVYLIVGPSMARSGTGPLAADWAASSAPPAAPLPTHRCPHCDAAVQPSFKVCPYCAGTLRCASCEGPLQKDWKVCPRCGTPVP